MAAQLAGSRIASWIRFTRSVTSVGSLTAVCTIANSSPPSRATMSVSRRQPRSRVGDGLEQFVAALVPERVVDALEFVEVQIKHRELLAAPHALERLLELLAEKHPVGQIGQRVVVRQMRDPLFGQLALGDVLDHAQQILRLARRCRE